MGGAARAQEGKLAVCEQRQPQRAAPLPCSADSPPSHTLTLRSTACLSPTVTSASGAQERWPPCA